MFTDNALQHFPECHGTAGGGTLPGPAGGGYPARSSRGGYPGGGYPGQGGYPGWGGTLARGVPWLGGYPGWGGTQLGQHREYLLHGGQYASCVHAGGLSCYLWNEKIKWEQESPPAWTQEAYHPPCSKYSLCCPVLADPPLSAGPDPPVSWTWSPPPQSAGPDPPPTDHWPPLLSRLADLPPPPRGQTNTCENSTFPSYYVRGR